MLQQLLRHRIFIAYYLFLMSVLFASYIFSIRVNKSHYRLPLQVIPTEGSCKNLTKISGLRKPVALVSAPGCGSIWLRYLLQQATGILTGSIRSNLYLYLNGFPGEYVTDESVLVVQTHYFVKRALAKVKFDSAVLLMRNPRDTILATYNMQYANSMLKSKIYKGKTTLANIENVHNVVAPPSVFKKFDDEWSLLFTNFLNEWTRFYIDWLTNYRGTIHVVFYENLINNTRNELQAILKFLNVTVSEWDISCAIKRQNDMDNIYRRVRKYKYFDPFTKEMYKKIESAKNTVYGLLKQ